MFCMSTVCIFCVLKNKNLFKKKGGELRLCVDYRALNNITKRNRYPLPLISDLLDQLRGAKVYTKLDLRGAYNLIRVREGDEWKMVFQTKFGLYETLVMNFGLSNAPATFQHFVNDIYRFLVIYLDDFLVYSRSQTEHDQHVRMVLQRLRDHGLYAKLEKCAFDLKEVDFLGYHVSPLGLSMDPAKVSAVLEWRAPTNKKEVQRFLGFANYYRKFIPDFACWTDPITSCIRGKRPFRWTEQAEKGFQQLKRLFTTQPILQHPDPNTPFVVQADASDVAVGAVLMQPVGEHLHPCAYYSRQLTAPERNYTIWEKELLAIKVAFENWRHWLEGAKFPIEVHTDHRNLEHLRTAQKLNQRQQRWALFFERFDFRIHYVTPAQTKQADALSRKPEYAAGRKDIPETQLLQPENFATLTVGNTKSTSAEPASSSTKSTSTDSLSTQEIRTSQQTDAWAQEQIQRGLQFPFSLKNGLLCYRNHVYVPPGAGREKALSLCHDSKPAGHFGLFKTMHLILRDFWWPKIRKDVENYVNSCPTCQRSKTRREKPSGLLHPLPTPSRPWEIISADFITDLPPSLGFTTILVVVDLFTKMAHFIPCEGLPTAKETADLLLQHVFRLHGLPKSLVTDRGSQFTSRFWRALQKLLGIDSRLSSAHHPQTDGQTERTNATLEQYLRCYVNYQQDNWASLLPLSEFAFNNGVQNSTKEAPFFANYGFHPRFFPPIVETSEVPAAENWLQELTAVQELLHQQLDQAKEDYKRHADSHRQPGPEIKVGDRVWLSTRFLPSHRPCRKLDARFIGPYTVVAHLNPVTFKLQLPRSMRIHPVFHRSLLLPADGVRPDVYQLPPAPTLVDGEEEFEVQDILDSRIHRRRLQYLIDWVGYGPEERSWEDASTVHAPDLVQRFHRTYPSKPRPRGSRGAGPVG
uniref:Gypsy retrotransposon integrase-like protein 1 n=1 Tax=Anolis carolinensis TaxID=28377 RepID=A0A803SPZ4_ANOCA